MVVCKYYLKGDCKFGDRCRFEHPRGGSGGSYQSYGGGGYQNYGGGGSFGSKDSGNYSNYSQQQSNYKNPYVYHKDPGGRGQGGGEGGAKKVAFRDSFGSFGGNENRFGALSGLGGQMPNDDVKDQEILDAVKHDMEEWEGSKIWPLSSYKANKSRCVCLPGFEDISPEEVRFLAYTAEKENKFDQHKASFASVLSIYNGQRDVLKKPSRDMKAQLINAYRGGPTPESIFGNTDSAVQILYSGASPGGSGQSLGTGSFGSTSTGLGSTSTGFGSTSTGFGSMSSSNSSGFGGGTFGNTPSGNVGGTFGTQGQSGSGTSAGLFGKPAATGTTGTGLFGKTASNDTPGTGFFGKQAVGGTGTGLFGKPTSSGTTGLFGKPAATGTNDNGVSGGIAGGSTGLFGKPATFGGSQSSSFGTTQGDFGSSQSGGTGASSGSQGGTYTPLSELTAEEKEQFEAASFTLGKVPTRPPPMELCR